MLIDFIADFKVKLTGCGKQNPKTSPQASHPSLFSQTLIQTLDEGTFQMEVRLLIS